MSNPLREICICTRPTGDSRALCGLSQPALENGIHGLILGVPVPRSARRPLLAAGSVRSEGSRRKWAHTSAPRRGGSGTRGTGGAERRGAQMMARRLPRGGRSPSACCRGQRRMGLFFWKGCRIQRQRVAQALRGSAGRGLKGPGSLCDRDFFTCKMRRIPDLPAPQGWCFESVNRMCMKVPGKHESLDEGGNILRRARGLCLQQGLYSTAPLPGLPRGCWR